MFAQCLLTLTLSKHTLRYTGVNFDVFQTLIHGAISRTPLKQIKDRSWDR